MRNRNSLITATLAACTVLATAAGAAGAGGPQGEGGAAMQQAGQAAQQQRSMSQEAIPARDRAMDRDRDSDPSTIRSDCCRATTIASASRTSC